MNIKKYIDSEMHKLNDERRRNYVLNHSIRDFLIDIGEHIKLYTIEEIVNHIKEMQEIQKESSGSDYDIGLYNGMELILANLTDAEPKYLKLRGDINGKK